MRPFTEPDLERYKDQPAEKQRHRHFNIRLSSFRTHVEHAFGMLKGHFPALKGLSPAKNMKDTYRDVAAMMVIHNICVDLADHPEKEYSPTDPSVEEPQAEVELAEHGGNIGDDVEINVPAGETDTALKNLGYALRERLLDELYPK